MPAYLYSVLERSAKQEKCCGVVITLFTHQNKGIFQRYLFRFFFVEIPSEKLEHLIVAHSLKLKKSY
jgi:hypothetical protein